MPMLGETIRERGDWRKLMQIPKDGGVRSGAVSQLRGYSSEGEATKKIVEKHMPRIIPSSMEEEVGSAASKRKGARLPLKSKKRRRISKSKATPRISNGKPKRCFFVKPKKGFSAKGAEKHKFYYYKNSKYTKEELKKRWRDKFPVGKEDFAGTRDFSQAALTYYNQKHHADFVLVKPVMLYMMCAGPAHFIFHVNFKAKKQNDDDRDAVLFFAEVELRDPPCVVVCTILDATTEIQMYCQCCYPGWIQHPVDGFNENCQGPCIDSDHHTEDYVSSPEQLKSDADSASNECPVFA